MKAAVLYGDSVRFASPFLASLVAQFLLTTSLTVDRFQQEAADDSVDLREVQDSIRASLRRIHANTAPSRITLYLAGYALKEAAAQGLIERSELVAEHLRQLLSLSEHGLVELPVGDLEAFLDADRAGAEAAMVQVIAEFLRLLRYGSANVYPLLALGPRLTLRQTPVPEGVDFTRANRVEMATQVLGTLPGLPDASADELIDLRRILQPHLAAFRAALSEAEAGLDVDITAAEFDDAVHDYIERVVAPAVAQLQQQMTDLDVVSTVSRAVKDRKTVLGGIAVAVSPGFGASTLMQAIAVTAGASALVGEEVLHRRAVQRDAGRNPFFLLYRAQQRLSV